MGDNGWAEEDAAVAEEVDMGKSDDVTGCGGLKKKHHKIQ